jgi:hypothetical protein
VRHEAGAPLDPCGEQGTFHIDFLLPETYYGAAGR